MENIDELSFDLLPVADWSVKNTEEWLKSCLNRYQLDDPKLFSKIKMKGKTLLIYHEYRELNKFYADNHADQLHEDLDVRLGRTLVMPQTSKLSRISTQRKPTLTALWDKFEKQLDDINIDFGKLLDGNRTSSPYANELIIESLYALKGNGNVLPIECLISRMSNSFFKQYTTPTKCDTPLQHLESGHIKLYLPIDDAVGAFVQKFYLHGYPALAELMLEQILYLGQLSAIDTNYKSNQYPAIFIVPTPNKKESDAKEEILPFHYEERKARHSNESDDSGYRSKNVSPRGSIGSGNHSPLFHLLAKELEAIEEISEPRESSSRQSTNSPFDDYFQIERNQNLVFIEENNFVVDYATDQIGDDEKVSFKYDSDLSIKFEVTAKGNEPKTVTNLQNLFQVTIENNTTEDVGFSLRAYNLSMPGDIKVLHSSPGFAFDILKGKTSRNEDKWVHDIELIDKLIDLAGDYIIFELVLCSLDNGSGNSLKGNRWNIQRNYIQIKCASESASEKTDHETRKELHALVNKSMGNEKRKKCIKILLDSLYYFSYNDQEKAYKLATQLLLLPDFQRPQLLIFCWLIIGTNIFQGDTLDFSKQRKLIALINAGTCIKRKLELLNINLLSNIVKFSDKSIIILQRYLERHKLKRCQSCPENMKASAKTSIPTIQIPSIKSPTPEPQDSAITSPEEQDSNQKSLRNASSEPSLHSLVSKDSSHENSKIKAPILKYRTTRVAKDCVETLIFGDCEILCPPSETGIEIAFGYAKMDTYSSQTTIVPSVSHFATLELTNDLDSERYSEPYNIKFPIPCNISKTVVIRVVYQNGGLTEDITDKVVHDFNLRSHTGSIEAAGNGTYIILGVEGSPSVLTCYVANDITSVRPLYVHLWLKKVDGFAKWREIWCCISCKEELLIRPPIAEAWPVSKLVLNTKYNDKIEFSLLPKRKELSPSIEPEMRYEFNLTETQGVFNFVHILNLDIVGNESIFRIQNQENKMEKEIQFGKFL